MLSFYLVIYSKYLNNTDKYFDKFYSQYLFNNNIIFSLYIYISCKIDIYFYIQKNY
jgi:hypothetical protein